MSVQLEPIFGKRTSNSNREPPYLGNAHRILSVRRIDTYGVDAGEPTLDSVSDLFANAPRGCAPIAFAVLLGKIYCCNVHEEHHAVYRRFILG